jgi:hypothetical protein
VDSVEDRLDKAKGASEGRGTGVATMGVCEFLFFALLFEGGAVVNLNAYLKSVLKSVEKPVVL